MTGASAQAAPIRADGPEDSGTGVNAPLSNVKTARKNISDAAARESICLMVESAARANGLPLEFFARVIWQESRFRPRAVGPVTRSGDRAQGIAQFMPGTAAERSLLDPFDPVQALPKSAEFLRELRETFGNLGLAAAAYNAGPRRVREWLDGTGPMPGETRRYVFAITGATVEEWAKGKDAVAEKQGPTPTCRQLIALLERAPNPFVEELERRIVLGARKPWGVQLSAGFSRDKALSSYSRIAHRYAKVLAGQDPSILRSTNRSRGTRAFYQVRVGAETRGAANVLCGQIRRVGGACLVLRNPRG
ncbi:MAG: lytic transglycosylase domain-containing protein [Rhizobiales bacterium]|nr:lytic transglycosylase domain-containing protein [Hyphomicrobiales bacterium]